MRRSVVCLLLAAATVALYAQVASFEFVNLDDPLYVTDNEAVRRGLSLDGLRWAFTTGRASNWHPLTWLSHMLDCQLFGLNPRGHHMTSVALHALNACLVFFVLHTLTGRIGPPAFAAALFALHPLRVESVAWIAERKDLLSAAFGLAAIAAWTGWTRRPTIPRYALAAGLLAAGLMAKPMLVTLPFVLLVLDSWPLERTRVNSWRALVVEKLPLFALAAASSIVTLLVQRAGGAVKSEAAFPLGVRLANAVVSHVRYLCKTIWPAELSIVYAHPALPEGEPWTALQVAGALALLAGITVAALLLRRWRYVLAGWLWFAGMLLPVSGIVQVGIQAMSDRYTYLPSIGLFVIMAWGAADLLAPPQRRVRVPPIWLATCALLVLVPLGVRTWFQTRHWRDSFELYEHALSIDPDNPFAHLNLGAAYESEQMVHDAVEHFRAVLAVEPRNAKAHLGLANGLRTLRDADGAIRHYRLAIDNAPSMAPAHFNLGLMLRAAGRLEEAIAEYRRAIELDPGHADALSNLGSALLARGSTEEAVEVLRRAVSVQPDHAAAQSNLGVALVRTGHAGEALEAFARAAQADPSWPQPLMASAWLLATGAASASPGEAIRLAERAVNLTERSNPIALDALAAAYAASGRFDEALTAAEQAAALAERTGRAPLAASIRARLEILRQRRPIPLAAAPIPGLQSGNLD